MRKGACGMAGPVKLSALGESTSVAVRPAATLNCRTVARIHQWVEEKVQPAAMATLQSRVVRIRNVSSYTCRNRNNAKTGKLSHHSFGNALDIAGFELADGRTVSVLKDWGPVKRDVAFEKIKTNKVTTTKTAIAPAPRIVKTSATVAVIPTAVERPVPIPVFKGPVRRGVRLNRIPDPGGPPAIALADAPEAVEPKQPPQPAAKSVFLKRIHTEACGIFGTVLGPEANDAHRDHFHVDTAKRRYKAYCR